LGGDKFNLNRARNRARIRGVGNPCPILALEGEERTGVGELESEEGGWRQRQLE
jgi:hypothetical protein